VADSHETAVPTGAIDCGEGFYIEMGTEPIGEVRYAACMPGGAICRYANDLWQAQIYIEHLKGNRCP
jgi:hypothetical protein